MIQWLILLKNKGDLKNENNYWYNRLLYNSYSDIRDMFRYKKHTKLDKQFKQSFGA